MIDETFRSIANRCYNLKFAYSDQQIEPCLKALDSCEAKLINIQDIKVKRLSNCSIDIRTLHLQVASRFWHTITSLEISDVAGNGTSQDFGGFYGFLSGFKQIKYLKLQAG